MISCIKCGKNTHKWFTVDMCDDCREQLAMKGTEAILDLIRKERERQRKKFGDAAHDTYDTTRWLAVLMEEVGEAAQVSNDEALGKLSPEGAEKDLKAELVQVAAVAVAWLEAIERREARR